MCACSCKSTGLCECTSDEDLCVHVAVNLQGCVSVHLMRICVCMDL